MKRQTIVNALDYGFYPFARLAGSSRGLRILMYHLISVCARPNEKNQITVSVKRFREQMELVKNSGFKVVSLKDAITLLEAGGNAEQCMALTFDDFYAETIDNAVPMLKEFGFPASFYVITDYIGSNKIYPWLEPGQDYPCPGTGKMAQEIASLGFEIGSHTCSHPVMSRLAPERVADELVRSRKVLEDLCGKPVDLFSYPYGLPSVSPEWVQRKVAEAGYALGLGTLMGTNFDFRSPYYLRRNRISEFDCGGQFLKKLKGAEDWYIIWQRLRDK